MRLTSFGQDEMELVVDVAGLRWRRRDRTDRSVLQIVSGDPVSIFFIPHGDQGVAGKVIKSSGRGGAKVIHPISRNALTYKRSTIFLAGFAAASLPGHRIFLDNLLDHPVVRAISGESFDRRGERSRGVGDEFFVAQVDDARTSASAVVPFHEVVPPVSGRVARILEFVFDEWTEIPSGVVGVIASAKELVVDLSEAADHGGISGLKFPHPMKVKGHHHIAAISAEVPRVIEPFPPGPVVVKNARASDGEDVVLGVGDLHHFRGHLAEPGSAGLRVLAVQMKIQRSSILGGEDSIESIRNRAHRDDDAILHRRESHSGVLPRCGGARIGHDRHDTKQTRVSVNRNASELGVSVSEQGGYAGGSKQSTGVNNEWTGRF